MMVRLLLWAAAAVLLALGGESLYHTFRSRTETVIGCADFVRTRPLSNRVRVTDCEIDYAGAGYRESAGQIQELFFPARPAGAPTIAAPIVAATRDPSALAILQGVLGDGQRASAAESLAAMQKIVETQRMKSELVGVVRAGFVQRLRTGRILSGLATTLALDVAIIDLQGTPNSLQPAIMLSLGLLLGTVASLLARPTKRTVGAGVELPGPPMAPPESAPGRATPSQYEPASQKVISHAWTTPSLPALLLLKLDASAGPDAIETAPPLGSRADLVAILRGVISDLEVDTKRQVLSRRDGSVRFDLGSTDPVPTVVVQARGEAGVALVKEVLDLTGWRAFAPKTGLFMTPADMEALAALAVEVL
jgi:hypothetical protein